MAKFKVTECPGDLFKFDRFELVPVEAPSQQIPIPAYVYWDDRTERGKLQGCGDNR